VGASNRRRLSGITPHLAGGGCVGRKAGRQQKCESQIDVWRVRVLFAVTDMFFFVRLSPTIEPKTRAICMVA
jgi:hypothetical protein